MRSISNNLVRQGYNQVASSYDSERNQFENTVYLEKLNSLLSPNSTILDIGCGAGKPVDAYFISEK